MKVKLKTPYSGIKGSWGMGDVIDVPKDEADRLFAKDLAEPVQAAREPRGRKKADD